MGGINVDEDGFGGRSPSRQGAGTGTYVPTTRVSDGGVDLNRIWKNLSGALVLGHDE